MLRLAAAAACVHPVASLVEADRTSGVRFRDARLMLHPQQAKNSLAGERHMLPMQTNRIR